MMTPYEKCIALFLLLCIPSRASIAYLAKNISSEYLPYMGTVALIPAIGFLLIFLTGSRKTGFETFGSKIWWNSLRPLHSLLYFAFAIAAVQKKEYAWKFLALDVAIGLIAFVIHHSKDLV